MMTTLVSAINAGMDPRQATQQMHSKVDENTAVEELKAEEQQQADAVSAPIKIMNSSADIKMLQIHQAAEAGILRPVWLEMLEMDPNMPRTIDMIRRTGKSKDGEAERAAEESERAARAERAEESAERVFKSERVAENAERTVKTTGTSEGTERAVKSEGAPQEAGQAATSSQ